MPRNELRLLAGLLSSAHLAQIRRTAQDSRERALVECLFTARRAEVAQLQWGDLNLDTGLVQIRRGKGGQASWTLLLPSTRIALVDWRRDCGSSDPMEYVFPKPGSGRPSQPYTPGGLANLVEKILTRAGCWRSGQGNCHRLRRSFATAYLKANPSDVIGLQRLMRHRDVRTTSLYVHYQPDDLAPRLANVAL